MTEEKKVPDMIDRYAEIMKELCSRKVTRITIDFSNVSLDEFMPWRWEKTKDKK